MAKRLSYEEKFKRLKERIKDEAMQDFFAKYNEMKEIEEGLLKEKII